MFYFSRGGVEEAAGRDQCGLPAAGAGERAKQEDRPGAEDEWGAQNQVRERQKAEPSTRQEIRLNVQKKGSKSEGMPGNGDSALCDNSADQSLS